MNVCMIGTGYVGLVAGACFADTGNDVVCVDIDVEKIEALQRGIVPIYEPGLSELIVRNVQERRLTFTADLASAVQQSEVLFVAVGTPTSSSGAADLAAVLKVTEDVGRYMNGYKVIVMKSTVPVGTSERVRDVLRKATDHSFDLVSNPEFLKQGAAVDDFIKPDRVVVGADNAHAADIMRRLYAPFLRTGSPVLMMDIRTAELVKYAANAFLAARISFMNEVANLCEEVGADIEMVRKGLATDARIGPSFLFAGVGFGGSCFPKDIRALSHTGREHDYEMKIVEAVDAVNQQQSVRFVSKIQKHFAGQMRGKRIAVWGLAFKPRTNDMRDAPSIRIIDALLAEGCSVVAYDPEATSEGRKIFGDRIAYAADCYDCLVEADALVAVTEWQVFRNPNFARMKSLMRSPVVFDGRNIFEPASMRQMGFTYSSIGRP